jgi:DNA (cytosine-5)-methyltransferase 1
MPNIISLFAGGGGLDLGFSAAGFTVVYSNDIDHHSCQTLRLNQNRTDYYTQHVVQEQSVTDLDTDDVLRQIDKTKDEIDFVIGGPPCQSFSVFGKRKGLEDPRGNLVFEYARIIKELKPRGFLFENVSGLRTIHEGQFYKDLLDVLSFEGEYTVSAYESLLGHARALLFRGWNLRTRPPIAFLMHTDLTER